MIASIGFLKDVLSRSKRPWDPPTIFLMDGDSILNSDVVNTLIKNQGLVCHQGALLARPGLSAIIRLQLKSRREGRRRLHVNASKRNRTLNIAIFRKLHQTRKNYQWTCSIPMTAPSNTVRWLPISKLRALYGFRSRRLHAKAVFRTQDGFTCDTILTDDYQANSAWQQFVRMRTTFIVASKAKPDAKTQSHLEKYQPMGSTP